MKLRPYQIADLKKIDAAFAAGHRAVLHQSPTGSGKTVTFSDLVEREARAGGRVLILGHRDEIVQQVSQALRGLGVRHGILAPGYPQTSHRVQVASVMSLVRRLHRLRPAPTLLIVDEAHHAVAATWRKIIEAFPDAEILGVTATPRRLDGQPLNDMFDHLVVGPSIASLVDDGWLAASTVFTPPNTPDLARVRVRAGDYATDQLAGVMSNGIIVDGAVAEYERLCPGVPAIAFCVDIAHSNLVAEAFQASRWRAAHLDGETPRAERRRLIAALGDGSIDVLCNCGLISEGLDVPGVVAAVLLRPTKSLALYLQMVGRALRPAPDKDEAFILDHAGNVYRHGLPTARRRWTLHGQQQPDTAAERLIRCPACGAVNDPGAVACAHCGATLHRQRAPHIVVAGRKLAEVVEAPRDDAELAAMAYQDLLRWAADDDGHLVASKLQRVAAVRGYKAGWAWHMAGKEWREVWEAAREWRQQQLAGNAR